MPREVPLPVRPSLNALLAQRGAPWKVRRPLAAAVATAIRLHAPRTWEHYMSWALLRTTDPPRQERRKKGTVMDDSGKVIQETPEQTAAYEQAKGPATNGHGPVAALDADLAARKRRRADAHAAERAQWLERSGFALLISQAQAALAALPQARAEHALVLAEHAATFDRLEAGLDQLLVPRAFKGEIASLRVRGEVYAPENEVALRALITRVLAADLADVNGPVKNPNTVTAWRRQFQELMPNLPRPGWAAAHRTRVHALLERIQAARGGRGQ